MLVSPVIGSLDGLGEILSADVVLNIHLDIFAEGAVDLSVACFQNIEIFSCD